MVKQRGKKSTKGPRSTDTRRRAFLRKIAKPFIWGTKVAKAKATNHIIRLKTISRREAIVRGGVGAATFVGAYLGVKNISRRIPFWLGAKRRYSLHMAFGEHASVKGVKNVIDEIKRAKKAGKPYHVFFQESASATGANFAKKVQNSIDASRKFPVYYIRLRKQD